VNGDDAIETHGIHRLEDVKTNGIDTLGDLCAFAVALTISPTTFTLVASQNAVMAAHAVGLIWNTVSEHKDSSETTP
jgi:hypothetical protein